MASALGLFLVLGSVSAMAGEDSGRDVVARENEVVVLVDDQGKLGSAGKRRPAKIEGRARTKNGTYTYMINVMSNGPAMAFKEGDFSFVHRAIDAAGERNCGIVRMKGRSWKACEGDEMVRTSGGKPWKMLHIFEDGSVFARNTDETSEDLLVKDEKFKAMRPTGERGAKDAAVVDRKSEKSTGGAGQPVGVGFSDETPASSAGKGAR